MYIIIGLGNPENKYVGTRHNMGFDVVDRLAYQHNITMDTVKHKALLGKGVIGGQKVLLAKPLTYMNLSGESVRALVDFYKVTPADIIVVYDDIALDLGRIRVREKGSAGGHNGMKNIILHLGTQEFVRVRVGVGEKPPRMDLADYVLSRYKAEEMPLVREGVVAAADAIELILEQGAPAAMNRFNG
ncbi:MAG: aminoacyl-tRNA hydrolase [Lachnospiraceae bacterium]|nr:aminoacyl-tRNA hydrolase [Lachnospiraceae bacterium]